MLLCDIIIFLNLALDAICSYQLIMIIFEENHLFLKKTVNLLTIKFESILNFILNPANQSMSSINSLFKLFP